MNMLDQSLDHSQFELTDGTMLPFSSHHDKLFSILNVLRGHEEFTISTGGVIISSNLEVVNITGYEEWEVIGKHFSILYSAEDLIKKQPERDLEMAVTEGKLITNSWKLKKKQIRFWARIKILPMLDSMGILRGFKIILKDATHKVFSEVKIQKIKNEYLNLYHNSIFGILRFRKESSEIILANRKSLEILDIGDFHNFLFSESFYNEVDYIRFRDAINNYHHVNNFEFQLKNSHGAKRWASIDCKVYGSEGFVEGVIIDVTDKKAQELAVQKLNNDLDTFIYHASHDLRAPLSSILGLLNLIDMPEQSNRVVEYSALIRNRIDHLDSLLKDLTTIAFNNHSEVNYERIFIKEEINFMLRDLVGRNNIQFVLHINDDYPFISDVLRFRTIIKNLVSNSVKFYNQIEKNPFVKITASSQKDKLSIEIEDNGIGMEKEEIDKIYSMFHRGHSKSGSGLGLYTVRSMVDQLGGTINLFSAIGHGTKVTIELPNK